jgi:hypothetical protein
MHWIQGAFSPEVKLLRPTSAEVKKTWMYTSSPPYVFIP